MLPPLDRRTKSTSHTHTTINYTNDPEHEDDRHQRRILLIGAQEGADICIYMNPKSQLCSMLGEDTYLTIYVYIYIFDVDFIHK